jgi:hypothetical protein
VRASEGERDEVSGGVDEAGAGVGSRGIPLDSAVRTGRFTAGIVAVGHVPDHGGRDGQKRPFCTHRHPESGKRRIVNRVTVGIDRAVSSRVGS